MLGPQRRVGVRLFLGGRRTAETPRPAGRPARRGGTLVKVFALLGNKAGYNLRNLRVNGLRRVSGRIFRAYPARAHAARRAASSLGECHCTGVGKTSAAVPVRCGTRHFDPRMSSGPSVGSQVGGPIEECWLVGRHAAPVRRLMCTLCRLVRAVIPEDICFAGPR